MNSSNSTPGEGQRRLNEAMGTYWVLALDVLASGTGDLVLAGLILSGGPGTANRALIVGVNLTTPSALTMVALPGRNLVSNGRRDSLTEPPRPSHSFRRVR